QAGLGDMTATDVAHATSLLQDYAPVYEMAEHHRTLQNSVDQFTSQHIAISNLRSAHPHEQEVLSMLQNNLLVRVRGTQIADRDVLGRELVDAVHVPTHRDQQSAFRAPARAGSTEHAAEQPRAGPRLLIAMCW